MEAQADQDAPCPAWAGFKRELLDMTCRVKTITNAVSVATVHVTGGARCTCTVRSNGEVPLKKAAEELSANVGKLVEEILRHAVDAQSVLRERKGRETARDSAYESRNSTAIYVLPVQETAVSSLENSENAEGHICVRL